MKRSSNVRYDLREVSRQDRPSDALEAGQPQGLDLLNAVAIAIYTTDADGLITFYNEAAAALWGCRPELGRSEFCGSWKLLSADGLPMRHDQCPMAVVLRERRAIRGSEAIAERPDGTRIPFMPFPTPLYDSDGRFVGAVNILIDITERKRAEDALARRVKEQAALYRFTDRLYRARSQDDVYDAALQAIVDMLGCSRAAILLYDQFGVMRFVAWRDLSEGYRAAVEGHSPWRPGDRHAQPICITDVLTSGEPDALKAIVSDEGIRSLAFIPIFIDGVVAGKFMSYFETPHAFTEHEKVMAVTIARQLGFSIGRSRADDARRQSDQSSRLLAAIVSSSEDAIVTKDLQGIITSWNAGAERLFGYPCEEVVGKPIYILIPSDRHDEEATILARIRSGERIDHYETVRRRKDGGLVDISLTVSPLRDANGTIVGASKIARDITDRRRAQERQKLLLREMDHRIKNLFTLASSVVGLSARSAETAAELSSDVRDRLAALARAQALTLSKPTDGAAGGQVTTLHALLQTILLPYDDRCKGAKGRVSISGADPSISGSAVTSLALLFNEFATNAAKYGSLSMPGGRIDISCAEVGSRLEVVWTETGGPPVQAPSSTGEGFGSILVEAAVKAQLNGDLVRDWKPEGLVIRLTASRASCTSS